MRSPRAPFVVCFCFLCAPLIPSGPVAAQEADVTERVRGTLAALTAGDRDAYLSEYAPGAQIFMLYGTPVEMALDDFLARAAEIDLTAGDLRTSLFGNVAVTVGEVDGTLPAPGGGVLEGPWRYSETRVRSRNGWRVVEQHFSPVASDVPLLPRPEVAVARALEAEDAPPPAPPAGSVAAEGPPPAAMLAPIGSDVPPPPEPPEVINRDDAGNATVRAIRLEEPLEIDGDLDEPVYSSVPPLDDFIQSLPDEGEPATELTEAWVMFDDENVYVSARVHEEVPESEWVANEMRRDANQIGNNDNFGLVFDTYYDRRNGYFFYTNPLGAMADIQVTNEGSPNFDWNPVWDVRTGRFDGGWTVEIRLPFKSIRYRPGTEQVWGFQLRRAIRRKNEWSHLTFVSRAAAGASGRMGIIRMSRAATLVGIEAPPAGLNLDVKPYGIAGLTTDLSTTPEIENDLDGDGGVDVKWGVTQNLAADLTYNTDFAQVEVDEQQVNLTRFNLFFPEKREFFLESSGIFNFPTTGPSGGFRGRGSAPTLFFSRRIGLQGGRPVPIIGGGRLTGKVGPVDVGALNIQTDDVPDVGAETTNFTAVRLRGDILARSNLGVLFTNRSRSLLGDGSSQTYGADASFSFFEDLYVSGYYARTETPLSSPRNQSYQGSVSYEGDLGGFRASHLLVEDDFSPEVGFLRRSDFRQTQLSLRGSPRPSTESVRQVTLEGSVDYLENARLGFLESREISGRLRIELENSDQLTLTYTDSYENLVEEERITGGTIPVGRYAFDAVEASYSFGPQRFFSGNLSARHGGFFGGDLTSVGFSRGRIEVLPQLSLEPSVSLNWVDLPGQRYQTTLAVTRVNYSFTPRMFVSGLVQYNSSNDSFSANLRLRWEYSPGSEIFLVYTEERDTFDFRRFPGLSNRGLQLKVTRLLRF